jgi:hypothetical protein
VRRYGFGSAIDIGLVGRVGADAGYAEEFQQFF